MSSNQRSGLPRIGYLIAALLCGLFLLALAGCGSARSISNADPPAGSYASIRESVSHHMFRA